MYCRNCGTPCADDAKFCQSCGTPTQSTAPAQPAPVQAAPTQPAPAQVGKTDAAASVKKVMHFIVAGMAVWALILSILNLFGLYNVSISFGFFSVPVSDLYSDSTALLIGNILYGLISLVIACVGALYFLKAFRNMDLYDKFIGKFVNPLLSKFVDGDGIATLIGIVGTAAGILQLFFYLIAGDMYSVSMNFTSWLALVIYIALAACDLFWLNKKKR